MRVQSPPSSKLELTTARVLAYVNLPLTIAAVLCFPVLYLEGLLGKTSVFYLLFLGAGLVSVIGYFRITAGNLHAADRKAFWLLSFFTNFFLLCFFAIRGLQLPEESVSLLNKYIGLLSYPLAVAVVSLLHFLSIRLPEDAYQHNALPRERHEEQFDYSGEL